MAYVKFINEDEIEEAPSNKGGVFNYNDVSNSDVLLAAGYKPLLLPEYPAGMKQPVVKYRELADCIDAYYVEGYVEPPVYEPTYAEKRAAEYPPMTEYLDAQVKINSGVEELMAEGQEQLSIYYADCLEIKAKYPKPSNKTEA